MLESVISWVIPFALKNWVPITLLTAHIFMFGFVALLKLIRFTPALEFMNSAGEWEAAWIGIKHAITRLVRRDITNYIFNRGVKTEFEDLPPDLAQTCMDEYHYYSFWYYLTRVDMLILVLAYRYEIAALLTEFNITLETLLKLIVTML